MPLNGSADSVVAAIRDDAAAEAERIENAAAEEMAAQRATMRRVPAAAADRDQRLATARRRDAEALAQAEWEARRAFIEEREAWIERVVARGREILKRTSAEALDRLRTEAIATVGDERAEVVAASCGGCVARAGNLVADNSFDERARRFESAWRAAVAEMYRV